MPQIEWIFGAGHLKNKIKSPIEVFSGQQNVGISVSISISISLRENWFPKHTLKFPKRGKTMLKLREKSIVKIFSIFRFDIIHCTTSLFSPNYHNKWRSNHNRLTSIDTDEFVLEEIWNLISNSSIYAPRH